MNLPDRFGPIRNYHVAALLRGLEVAGLDADAIQFVSTQDRAAVGTTQEIAHA